MDYQDAPMTEAALIGSLLVQIMSIPFQKEKIQAIACMTGLGETWAVTKPVELWEQGLGDYLLVAGMNPKDAGYHPMTIEELQKPPYNLRRTDYVHTLETAYNTPAQTDWIIKTALDLDIERIVLMVRPYHLPRAYLTLLKSWQKLANRKMVLIPVAIPVPPDAVVLDKQLPSRAMIPGEMGRIPLYQAKGDIATLDELNTYLDSIRDDIYG